MNNNDSRSVWPPSLSTNVHALFRSTTQWAKNVLHLAMVEGKSAGVRIFLILGLCVGTLILFIAAWFSVLGAAVAALVGNQILGLAMSLLVVALFNLMGMAALMCLAYKQSKRGLFCATRRQLGLNAGSGEST